MNVGIGPFEATTHCEEHNKIMVQGDIATRDCKREVWIGSFHSELGIRVLLSDVDCAVVVNTCAGVVEGRQKVGWEISRA